MKENNNFGSLSRVKLKRKDLYNVDGDDILAPDEIDLQDGEGRSTEAALRQLARIDK